MKMELKNKNKLVMMNKYNNKNIKIIILLF